MTMVDWLLTEQLVEIFQEALAKRRGLNAELIVRDPFGEEDVLAGAGTAVRIAARDGSAYVVTPRRVARVVSEDAHDLVAFPELIGYDWISPEMSKKVSLKDDYFDRLYLYPRDAPPIVLDRLGDSVYPLMTFLGRVLEFQSQKVLLRKLDDDVVELLGRTLLAVSRGPFFEDTELVSILGSGRESLRVIAGMWPRMNLAAPDLRELLSRLVEVLMQGASEGRWPDQVWDEWIQDSPTRLETAVEIFRRVSTGQV
ncbi:MAG: hypothetical protein P8L45_06120 [Longimicrobiales bacterium]|nr:hypothetical protein [Longimicrobiales bacterium]